MRQQNRFQRLDDVQARLQRHSARISPSLPTLNAMIRRPKGDSSSAFHAVMIILLFVSFIIMGITALSQQEQSLEADSVALEAEPAEPTEYLAGYDEGIFDTCMAFSSRLKLATADEALERCSQVVLDAAKQGLGEASQKQGRFERWLGAADSSQT